MIKRFFSIYYILFDRYFNLEEYGVEKTLRLAYYLTEKGIWDSGYSFFIYKDVIECHPLIECIKRHNPKDINIRVDYFYDFDLIKILELKQDIKRINHYKKGI